VAYRAVPKPTNQPATVPIPLGLIPLLANLPELDPNKPGFNVFELGNLLYNPPWNLQLIAPPAPSSDITISLAKDKLAVDLGDIKSIFPDDHTRAGSVMHGPSLGVSLQHFFLGVMPMVEYENDLSLNEPLHAALANGAPFTPNTYYALYDNVRAQSAIGLQFGTALPLMQSGNPREGGMGLYAGIRGKLMRGLAYGSANNVAAFTTNDTLFGSNPVDVRYTGYLVDAGPDGGGWGGGADLGAVWIGRGLELGVGINDIGTQLAWKVRRSTAYNDSVSGGYVQQTLAQDQSFTSRVPSTTTVNAAIQLGQWTVAGDVTRGVNVTQAHLGTEVWRGPLALRFGTMLDGNQMMQVSGGTGFRLGRIGVDLALASNSRNLTRDRALELGAGLSLLK
jgi:hypothetical protein